MEYTAVPQTATRHVQEIQDNGLKMLMLLNTIFFLPPFNHHRDIPMPEKNGKTRPTRNLPAVRTQTDVALHDAGDKFRQSLGKAVKANLALAACASIFGARAGKHLWKSRGKRWFRTGTAFVKTAYYALVQDAFGSDVSIDTLNLDSAINDGKPVLSLTAEPVRPKKK